MVVVRFFIGKVGIVKFDFKGFLYLFIFNCLIRFINLKGVICIRKVFVMKIFLYI